MMNNRDGMQEYDGYPLPERRKLSKEELERMKKEHEERMKRILQANGIEWKGEK